MLVESVSVPCCMTDNEMVRYLFGLGRFGLRLGLENIRRLLKILGNPEERFKGIHIAGTNGKGSTGAMIESMLRCAGYRTGLYTSPHLVDFRERITVAGEWISLQDFRQYFEFLLPAIEEFSCTFFEVMTAVAFAYFADIKVDFAVVETGLGGRLDATNILNPVLTVITEIGLDHTQELGSTVPEIAAEKAGIIKPGVDLVCSASLSAALEVFENTCRERQSRFFPVVREVRIENVKLTQEGTEFDLTTAQAKYPALRLSLLGDYQIRNATAAIKVMELLQEQGFWIPWQAIYEGLWQTFWPGRLEIMQRDPVVVLDTAHNPDGVRHAVRAIQQIFDYEHLYFVVGILRDKNHKEMIATIASTADFVVTVTPNSSRALSASDLAAEAKKWTNNVRAEDDILRGFDRALKMACSDDLICVIGSHFTVSEVVRYYKSA